MRTSNLQKLRSLAKSFTRFDKTTKTEETLYYVEYTDLTYLEGLSADTLSLLKSKATSCTVITGQGGTRLSLLIPFCEVESILLKMNPEA